MKDNHKAAMTVTKYTNIQPMNVLASFEIWLNLADLRYDQGIAYYILTGIDY